MPISAVNGALLACCSYCCGDLLVADGGDAACRYCGNLEYVHAPPAPRTTDGWEACGLERRQTLAPFVRISVSMECSSIAGDIALTGCSTTSE